MISTLDCDTNTLYCQMTNCSASDFKQKYGKIVSDSMTQPVCDGPRLCKCPLFCPFCTIKVGGVVYSSRCHVILRAVMRHDIGLFVASWRSNRWKWPRVCRCIHRYFVLQRHFKCYVCNSFNLIGR